MLARNQVGSDLCAVDLIVDLGSLRGAPVWEMDNLNIFYLYRMSDQVQVIARSTGDLCR